MTADNRLGQTDANAVPMAGKSEAPQSEVDEDLAGQDAEVAAKMHVHWAKPHAEKGDVENISKAERPQLAHVLTRQRVCEKLMVTDELRTHLARLYCRVGRYVLL